MKRMLKWSGIILGSLIVLLAIAAVVLNRVGNGRLAAAPDVPVKAVEVPTDEAAIATGQRLAAISSCIECHGADLRGTVFVDEAPIGYIPAPNLTGGQGGVGGTYSDADWAGAIRHGVGADGRTLVLMPSYHYAAYSDDDLGALIAYLKAVPAVDNDLGPRKLSFPGAIIFGVLAYSDWSVGKIDHAAVGSDSPAAAPSAAYGEYLAATASCGSCHGEALTGNPGSDSPPGPNLTPGGALATWTEADFITALRTGQTPDGRELRAEMPWRGYAQMTETELRALWAYLQTLEAQASTLVE
ncbi:MAG: cytochrome c [Caldilineaceae bacterium]